MFEIDYETLVKMIDYLTFAVKHITCIENQFEHNPRYYHLLRNNCEPLKYDVEKVRDMLCDIRFHAKKENHEDNI